MKNCSLFGNFITRKFTDIYPDAETFLDEYKNNGMPTLISDSSAVTLYYLLYARYGNSHIANTDENQFAYKVWSTIFMYGPTWEKRLDVQLKLRNLSDEELRLGTKQINNHAYNPGTAPSTGTLDELNYINEQGTLNYKKGKVDAYVWLMDALKTDVTKSFIDKFEDLFIAIVEPSRPLWYITDIEEDEEEDV